LVTWVSARRSSLLSITSRMAPCLSGVPVNVAPGWGRRRRIAADWCDTQEPIWEDPARSSNLTRVPGVGKPRRCGFHGSLPAAGRRCKTERLKGRSVSRCCRPIIQPVVAMAGRGETCSPVALRCGSVVQNPLELFELVLQAGVSAKRVDALAA